MRRVLTLGATLLVLGSCQSDNAPTQPTDSADLVGVSARLVATTALPKADRFRARLTVESEPGTWSDTTYAKRTALNLGKVKRGSRIELDVRGYSMVGTDTVWKWFAHKKVDSVTGTLSWAVLEVEVFGLGLVPPTVGQALTLPGGSWYTTDSTLSWNSASPKTAVGSSGTLPALSGTVLRVRLRVGIPGTTDTLFGDTLRIAIPQKPIILPAARALKSTDLVQIVEGATGDTLEYCKGAGCTSWADYAAKFPAEVFLLRARARRGGLVSSIEEASFTIVTSLPPDTPSTIDSTVKKPTISPASGSLSPTDMITISAMSPRDTLRVKVGDSAWRDYAGAIPAGAFAIGAVSRRDGRYSDTAWSGFTVSTTKPASPTFTNTCKTECDPGTTIGLESTESGITIEYALLTDSTDWQTYGAAKIMLEESNTVLARAVRGSDTSATQRQPVAIVQPAVVKFTISRRTADTVWVDLKTTSGAMWFFSDLAADSALASPARSIAVPVLKSISAWASRGTRKSTIETFTATAEKPGRPTIAPTDSIIGLRDSIALSPAIIGDTIQYKIGSAGVWQDYKDRLPPGNGGPFTITVRARRNGQVSTDTVRTFFVDTAQIALPTISQDLSKPLDPGTEFVVSAPEGLTLEYTTDTTEAWSSTDASLKFTAENDTTVFARSRSTKKTSPTKVFAIRIQQPGSVNFTFSERTLDSVVVLISCARGDTILYSRNGESATIRSNGSSDSLLVALGMNESITARAKRGTKLGGTKTYTAIPTAPKAPQILPEGGAIRDTTRVRLSLGNVGDTLSYKVGATAAWIQYIDPFTLPKGTAVVYAKSTRYGFSSFDTATFTVQGRPDTVVFWGCASDCDPGTPLVLAAGAGSEIWWSTDTALIWSKYDQSKPPSILESETYWAYANSGGYVSAPTSRAIGVLQPQKPIMVSVSVTRDSAMQIATAVVQAGQQGDSLFVTVDGVTKIAERVLATPLQRSLQMTKIGSVLEAFTRRGTASTPAAERPQYELEAFPSPLPSSPSGAYTEGKVFKFTLAGNAKAGDAIHVSTDAGATWKKQDSIKLNETGKVWTRSVRAGFAGAFDSSEIRKLSYTMDTTILTSVIIRSGTSNYSRSLTDSPSMLIETLPYGNSTVVLTRIVRDAADLKSVTYSCTGCIGVQDSVFTTRDFGTSLITMTAVSKGGTVRAYVLKVTKTSPWNPAYPTGSVTDSRDGRTYKTVKIGSSTWMAQNLELERLSSAPLGQCTANDPVICGEFGRRYSWPEAMNFDSECNAMDCSSQITSPHQGICPIGFHVPSMEEWKGLLFTVDPLSDTITWDSKNSARKLRSLGPSWFAPLWTTAASDEFGFRALPSNLAITAGSNPAEIQGLSASWWSIEQDASDSSMNVRGVVLESGEKISHKSLTKSQPQPLRCVKD